MFLRNSFIRDPPASGLLQYSCLITVLYSSCYSLQEPARRSDCQFIGRSREQILLYFVLDPITNSFDKVWHAHLSITANPPLASLPKQQTAKPR